MSNSDAIEYDGYIEDDGYGEFTILKPGEYDFIVVEIEKLNAEKSGNPMVKLTLQVDDNGELINIIDRLVLIKSCEWKLSGFFRSIGLKKHGERLKLRWDIEGKKGRAKLGVRKYTNKDGNPREINEVKSYIDKTTKTAPKIEDDQDQLI